MAISLRLNTRRQITIATSTRLPRCARNDRLKRVCVRPAGGIKRELRRQVSWSVAVNVAAPPGFEPGLTAPKADVLPLHHGASGAGVVIPPYAVHLRPYIVRPVPGVVKAAPLPSPRRRGNPGTTPSPLMGEGWGEGEGEFATLCHCANPIEIANPRIEYSRNDNPQHPAS